MLHVTPEAQEQLGHLMKDREPSPIRVFVHSGCGGRTSMALALDDATSDDTTFDFEGIHFVIESRLLEQAKPVEVGYGEMGFTIESSLVFDNGGDGCGGCTGCG